MARKVAYSILLVVATIFLWLVAPKNATPAPSNVSDTKGVKDWYSYYVFNTDQVIIEQLAGVLLLAGKIGRVEGNLIARQIANLGIPISPTKEALVELLLSDKVEVVSCTKEILVGYFMSRTNYNGTKFDFEWERKECYKGEKIVLYKFEDGTKQAILSLFCGNVMTPKKKPEVKVATAVPASICPDGRRAILHIWSHELFPSDIKKLADDLTEKEMNQKESFTRGSTLSRTLGRTLRVRSNKGEFSRSTEPTKVSISLIRVGETNVRGDEFGVKSMHVFFFPEEVIKEKTISMVFSDESILSPPIGRNGLRELRMPWGEWTDCTMNMHAVRR